jgi:hypothetical protein
VAVAAAGRDVYGDWRRSVSSKKAAGGGGGLLGDGQQQWVDGCEAARPQSTGDSNGNDGLMLWCRRTVGGRNDGYVDSQTARERSAQL